MCHCLIVVDQAVLFKLQPVKTLLLRRLLSSGTRPGISAATNYQTLDESVAKSSGFRGILVNPLAQRSLLC